MSLRLTRERLCLPASISKEYVRQSLVRKQKRGKSNGSKNLPFSGREGTCHVDMSFFRVPVSGVENSIPMQMLGKQNNVNGSDKSEAEKKLICTNQHNKTERKRLFAREEKNNESTFVRHARRRLDVENSIKHIDRNKKASSLCDSEKKGVERGKIGRVQV